MRERAREIEPLSQSFADQLVLSETHRSTYNNLKTIIKIKGVVELALEIRNTSTTKTWVAYAGHLACDGVNWYKVRVYKLTWEAHPWTKFHRALSHREFATCAIRPPVVTQVTLSHWWSCQCVRLRYLHWRMPGQSCRRRLRSLHIKGSKSVMHIYYDKDTQSANIRGNPLHQASKWHLSS